MQELSDPTTLLMLVGWMLFNALVLGGLVAIFRPGDSGYFATYGQLAGWGICIGVSFVFISLALIGTPVVILEVLWWVIALKLFRLTIRQTLKLNIAQGVFYVVLVFGFAASFGHLLRN